MRLHEFETDRAEHCETVGLIVMCEWLHHANLRDAFLCLS
jgi:hypothetical protein